MNDLSCAQSDLPIIYERKSPREKRLKNTAIGRSRRTRMASRKLKMPDGGNMDLPVPDGFGGGLLGVTASGKWTMYIVGAALGAVAGFLIVYAATEINEAIEAR
jgi:hypothetical protein